VKSQKQASKPPRAPVVRKKGTKATDKNKENEDGNVGETSRKSTHPQVDGLYGIIFFDSYFCLLCKLFFKKI